MGVFMSGRASAAAGPPDKTDRPKRAIMTDAPLSQADLDALKEFDTPTVCNALEIIVPERRGHGYTVEPLFCARPDLPPIVGYARTSTIKSMEPVDFGSAAMKQKRKDWYAYVAKGGPTPSIILLQDIDPIPGYGAFWGEVQSNIHKGLGALGTVTNGSIRDIPVCADGFQMLAKAEAPSHAYVHNVEWDIEITVAGMTVKPGDLVHADRQGAVVIPSNEAARKIPETARLIARREAVLIKAAQQPDFDFDKLVKAIGDAAEIH
jgi:regulator of RNase E activity RraA